MVASDSTKNGLHSLGATANLCFDFQWYRLHIIRTAVTKKIKFNTSSYKGQICVALFPLSIMSAECSSTASILVHNTEILPHLVSKVCMRTVWTECVQHNIEIQSVNTRGMVDLMIIQIALPDTDYILVPRVNRPMCTSHKNKKHMQGDHTEILSK